MTPLASIINAVLAWGVARVLYWRGWLRDETVNKLACTGALCGADMHMDETAWRQREQA